MLALGTSNDWIGRTSDFVGTGTILLVATIASAAFLLLRSRAPTGAAVAGAALAALCTRATVELADLRPSSLWVLVVALSGAYAAWDLRRVLRRGR